MACDNNSVASQGEELSGKIFKFETFLHSFSITSCQSWTPYKRVIAQNSIENSFSSHECFISSDIDNPFPISKGMQHGRYRASNFHFVILR